jgi:hypothetical protein
MEPATSYNLASKLTSRTGGLLQAPAVYKGKCLQYIYQLVLNIFCTKISRRKCFMQEIFSFFYNFLFSISRRSFFSGPKCWSTGRLTLVDHQSHEAGQNLWWIISAPRSARWSMMPRNLEINGLYSTLRTIQYRGNIFKHNVYVCLEVTEQW